MAPLLPFAAGRLVVGFALALGLLGPAGAQTGRPVEAAAPRPAPARALSVNPHGLPAPLRLEVRQGMAVIRRDGKTYRVDPGTRVDLIAPFRLEVGASGRVRLSRPGEVQLDLAGSNHLEVAREGAQRRWTFELLGDVEVDQRFGTDTYVFAGGQVLQTGRCALRLEGRVGGGTWLEVRAGVPAELDLGGRYTFPLRPGWRRTLPERLGPRPATHRGIPAGR